MVETFAIDQDQERKVKWELPPSPFLSPVTVSEVDSDSVIGWGVAVYLIGVRNPVERREFEYKPAAMAHAEYVAAVGVWIGDQIFHPPHKIDRCVVVALTVPVEANP
jgi:hypothetical protein